MRTVPLAYGETCRALKWQQYIVSSGGQMAGLLDLHARVKARLKGWKFDKGRAFIEQVQWEQAFRARFPETALQRPIRQSEWFGNLNIGGSDGRVLR